MFGYPYKSLIKMFQLASAKIPIREPLLLILDTLYDCISSYNGHLHVGIVPLICRYYPQQSWYIVRILLGNNNKIYSCNDQ